MIDETIHVVITGRNTAPWAGSCIESLRAQSFRYFSCVVVDDASTDDSPHQIRRAIRDDARFRLIGLPERVSALRARMIGLEHLERPKPQEIVVFLDGDDWLYDSTALATIHATQHDRRLLVTYGGYVRTDGLAVESREYPVRVVLTGAFRDCAWLAFPARAFRFGLWDYVRGDALRDSRGSHYEVATDRAIFLPLLELAGTRSGCIHQPLYVYNRDTPFNVDKLRHDAAPIVREIHDKKPQRALARAQVARLLDAGQA